MSFEVDILRSVASLPGRSIPIAGIPLTVAITGYDVASACETLKDVNELNVEIGEARVDESAVCGIKLPQM